MAEEKLTGRGGKYNFPQCYPPADEETTRAAIGSIMYWYRRGNVKKCVTLEEIQQRCEEYITECYETGQRLTVEKLALALGITRAQLWEWEKGNDARADVIKKAKDCIASYDAELVTTNKMPAVPYIFRAKNYYGMRDQIDVVAASSAGLADVPAQEIMEKYAELPE